MGKLIALLLTRAKNKPGSGFAKVKAFSYLLCNLTT